MTLRPHALLAFLCVFLHTSCGRASFAAEGGGRDVSVALFTTSPVHRLTLTPLGPNAWMASCMRCAHTPLTAPLHVAGSGEIFAGGNLRATDEDTGEQRSAVGLWHVRASASTRALDVVLMLPSEQYVASVLSAEALLAEPAESLRALAIVARTYALNGTHFTAAQGHLPADLCDSTQCQAMRFGPVAPAVEAAVRATAGETLWFAGRRAEVFFSQHCGGTTEDGAVVWPRLHDVPYLRSHADPFCVRRDAAAWHTEVPVDTVLRVTRDEGWRLPASFASAGVAQRSGSHRALRIVFTGPEGQTTDVAASALRFALNRALGWNRVRSDLYEVALRNGVLVLDGRGHGHGVGLCQTGATEMAAEGKSAREILQFYFAGTAVRITPNDGGWRQEDVGALLVRSTQPMSPERRKLLLQTWSGAEKRFAPHHVLHPEVVFAPTTELFRQLTSQPGWMLASTRGSVTVLQPQSVLQAYGAVGQRTLLHEMLHILIETEATERAPLWLREGLVEVLAGEPTEGEPELSAKATDAALLQASSFPSSVRAHRAAAVRVHALVTRYGLSAVRSWMLSGVPAGVL